MIYLSVKKMTKIEDFLDRVKADMLNNVVFHQELIQISGVKYRVDIVDNKVIKIYDNCPLTVDELNIIKNGNI